MPSRLRNAFHALSVTSLLILCVPGAAAAANSAGQTAEEILDATGVMGGLVVHLGGSAELTAALRANERYLVHGLVDDREVLASARKLLRAKGVYGPVSVALFNGKHLPYAEGIVKLVVAEDAGEVTTAEIMRVLCPGGVAYVKQGGEWKKTVKPWPKEIDEWTHALHGPDNNAVSHDTVVGPPRHLKWVAEPQWARSHDHLSSVSVVVSSAGRIFSIVDEAPPAAVALPAQWRLVARDAFSGVLLWKREIEPWEGHLRGFRTGPAAIQRRLVAIGDTVYVTLGYGKPVTALDAATGETKHSYEGTDNALEIVCEDDVLYVVAGPAIAHGAAMTEHEKGRYAAYPSPGGKALMAINAKTGEQLWRKANADTSRLMPTALAVAGDRLFFQNTQELICLNTSTGQEEWRAVRPVTTNRWAWTAPTLVVHGDVVFSADRDANSMVQKEGAEPGKVLWVVYSQGGEAPAGKLIAFSAKTGKRLWDSKAREAYNAPVDVLIADGLLWTGVLVRAKEPGITQGLDPATGEVKRTRPPDGKFFQVGMGHHRCYRNKATDRYLVLGRSGVEWVDIKTGEGMADHWVRGACQYGVLPCNGLLYAPSHSCACYIEAKLNGFSALAAKREPSPARAGSDPAARLEKGPAYGCGEAAGAPSASEGDWPTYRHDAARTGRASSPLPDAFAQAWSEELGGELTSPVVADGKVFLAQVDRHAVLALDANSGEIVWRRTVGGRVDSPPTIYKGLCLFGCRDGYVYCLRAGDGEPAWRFRAAPEDRQIVTYNRLESVWPVHGNILIQDGSAYFAAGRCPFIDGGIHLYRLDPVTGEVQTHRRIDPRDPKTGREPQKDIRGVFMPGMLPDVFSSDGQHLYMRHSRFDFALNEQKPDVPHLFAPAGFLDGSWWHRTYWQFGTRMMTGWGGWGRAGYRVPAGRMMVVDASAVYAFGRLNQYGTAGTHVRLAPKYHPWGDEPKETPEYVLFATTKEPDLIKLQQKKRRRGRSTRIKPQWSRPTDMWVRAMVLGEDKLILAGSDDPMEAGKEHDCPFASQAKGVLRIVSPKDGAELSTCELSAPPTWDAMAAARGRLYLATTDGRLTCLRGK